MNLFRLLLFFLIVLSHGTFSASVYAQKPERGKQETLRNFKTGTLTGDWNGERTRLVEKGVDFEAEYFGDTFSILSGGINQKTDFSGLLEMELHLDGNRLLNWNGAKVFVYGIGTHGKDFIENVGSTHGVSNIVAPDTFKLLEIWFDQSFLEEQISVLFGLYDLNSEFDFRRTAQLFINGAIGLGLDFSESGKSGPSTFSTTSLSARIKIKPKPDFYYLGAVLDGVPGDPDNPNGIQIDFDSGDGLLIANEIGYESSHIQEGLNKAGFGSWVYTTKLDDLVRVDANGNPEKQTGTYGFYAFFDSAIFFEKGSSSQGLYSFFRIGIAEDSVNKVDLYLDGGLVYRGLFPNRDEDKLGLAFSVARFTDAFKEKQEQSQILIEETEVLLELTYRFEVGSGIFLQPDFQYTFNPAEIKGASNAAVIGLRFAINL